MTSIGSLGTICMQLCEHRLFWFIVYFRFVGWCGVFPSVYFVLIVGDDDDDDDDWRS